MARIDQRHPGNASAAWAHVLLTHRDDVADAPRWAEHVLEEPVAHVTAPMSSMRSTSGMRR